jgi:hypothetical protein
MPAEPSPSPTLGLTVSERLWLTVAVALASIAMALDLFCAPWREWWQQRTLLAGLVSGGLIVPPLLIILERWITRRDRRAAELAAEREREQWHQPAVVALETFISASWTIVFEARRRMQDAARALPGQRLDPSERRTEAVWLDLGDEDPRFIETQISWFAEAATRAGTAALAATPALALYPPLAPYLSLTTAVPRLLRGMEEAATELRLTHVTGDAEQKRRAAERLNDLEYQISDQLLTVEHELGESDEEIRLPEHRPELPWPFSG